MILNQLQIANAQNGNVANATWATGARIGFTVSHFSHVYVTDGTEVPRMQAPGQWPFYEYDRKMVITQRGKIIGVDSADYNWQRRTLMLAWMPPNGAQTQHFHATLTVTPVGHPQIYAQVVLVDDDIPADATEPRSSDYLLTWRSDYAFWRAVSGNADYVI